MLHQLLTHSIIGLKVLAPYKACLLVLSKAEPIKGIDIPMEKYFKNRGIASIISNNKYT
jgi:hypothetical protein